MKTFTKVLSLLLVLALLFSLAACSNSNSSESTEPTTDEPTTTTEEPTTEETDSDTPLVVGYSPFSGKFSPFFATTAYDQDAASMTMVSLLNSDRTGAIIMNGIEGETIAYNGTDYTYYGPADCVITNNDDGTVYYDFTLRDDLTFSDGTPMTIDDVIFTMYVLCDPSYDGSSSLFAQPIEGMEEYRAGMDTLFNLIEAAGRDNTDFTYWTEEQQTTFWTDVDAAGTAMAQEIVDYCIANYGEDYGAVDVASSASLWGYSLDEGATAEDFWTAILAAYDGDIATAFSTESAGSTLDELMASYSDYQNAVATGETADSISGIQKTGDYSMRIVATQSDATMIYQLAVSIAPLHYYGDADAYDYDNNNFGFTKGDLSSVRAKTSDPLGAGPYIFKSYDNGVISYEANESYYLGAPVTKYINFMETNEADKLNGVVTGTIDITDPSFSTDTVGAIEDANGGELTGDVITTNTVDNLGYGYIGINSKNVCVNGEAGSDQSKYLRKAFATLFSVYRDVAIDSYYGDRASVINYPISNTSWAAPQATDEGYEIAYSKDVDGNDIYTSSMTDEEKYEAALQASLGFFEAAGYTVEDGKLTAAPEGASLEYEILIPADGTGDHPSFMILTLAHDALESIGMNLIVNDLSDSTELWDGLDAGTVEMWCAAWSATVDPDMTQIYYSDIANGGANPGGSWIDYQISDAELDELIIEAKASTDQSYRKALYKACLDIIIDWADEIPVYQRQNAIIFSTERVDMDTVTPDITTFYGWMSEIQNVALAK